MNFSEVEKNDSEVFKKSVDIPKFAENIKAQNITDFKEADKSIYLEKNSIDNKVSSSILENLNSEGINKVRDNYPNVDRKLLEIGNDIDNAQSPMDLQRQMSRIGKYKGTIAECMLKDSLKNKFESVEDSQRIVSTPEGDTKPDIVLVNANESIIIGKTVVNKGDDLFVEVKCGDASYIRNEMKHILKQVLGHEGKSVVIVTKDYYNISADKRAEFEANLAEKGSSICVLDVYSKDIEKSIIENVRR